MEKIKLLHDNKHLQQTRTHEGKSALEDEVLDALSVPRISLQSGQLQ